MRWWPAVVVVAGTVLGTLVGPSVLAEPVERPAPAGSAGLSGGRIGSGPVPGRLATAPKVAAAAGSRTVQAHYAAPARDSAGQIAIDRTLDVIIARGSSVYSYLLYSRAGYDSARDWQALPAFLTAARSRGVRVQVTLTPPASTSNNAHPCSADQLLPFRGRYDIWMAEIGKLARQHPNLTAVVMDDFSYSMANRQGARCRTFRPGTLTRWRGILRRNAGRSVEVMPVLYLHDMVGATAIYPSIRREAPAVVWPYVSIGESVMPSHYRAIRNASSPRPKVHVMVYAAPFRGRVPTATTIRREVRMATQLGAAGVVLYQQPLH